ncbi:hypothetical protein EG68_06541 [Paragonimus skrjabini miyazakii]|uniref:F-box domain-containing protein n=1 Tax=Paragonimus skrjabini miyazakii TaxID=59628 RepID=A0A8S9YJ22_9TREM|nr:hypothetical protein EG68_06541 [Paragonimus skrjabini miyazakii]
MPGNANSGSDSAESADDEDSESSSLPATSIKLRAALPTNEESLEAFYQDWMSEVERRRIGIGSLLPTNSGSRQSQVFSGSTPVFVHSSDLHSLFQSSVSTSDSALVDQLAKVKTSDELSDTVLQPDKDTPAKTHISVLPHELLLRIFRWAVGNHLDMRVLGKLACVCRGFRLLAYDPCLWRAICVRRWPTLTKHPLAGDVYPPQAFGYATWRDMAIQKPHVLLDGCYLCRISYVRAGEIVCTMQRPRSKEKPHPLRLRRQTLLLNTELQVTFTIRFKLASSKKRLHSVLHWDSYVIHTLNTTTQTDFTTSLDVSSDQFPACHFSPVRSYMSRIASGPL